MCPVPQSDGHDAPGLLDKFVPGFATMADGVLNGMEDAVGEPVVSQELPDVFGSVEFGAFWRQRDECDVRGHHEFVGQVPSGLIDEECGVSPGRHRGCDLGQMQAHRFGVAAWQHEGRTLAFFGTDGAEDVGRACALILRRRRPCAAPSLVLPFHPALPDGTLGKPRPSPGDLVFLPNPGFVSEPDLYLGWVDTLVARDLIQDGGKGLLKRSMAPSA